MTDTSRPLSAAELRDQRERLTGWAYMTSGQRSDARYLATIAERDREIERVSVENAELNELFTLQGTRTHEASMLWRAAHPGSDNILPDLGALLEWMLAENATLRSRVEELEKYAQHLDGCSWDPSSWNDGPTPCDCGRDAARIADRYKAERERDEAIDGMREAEALVISHEGHITVDEQTIRELRALCKEAAGYIKVNVKDCPGSQHVRAKLRAAGEAT